MPYSNVHYEKDLLREELEKTIASLVEAFGEDYYPVVRARNVLNKTSGDSELIRSLERAVELLDEARDRVVECANFELIYERLRPDRATHTMKVLNDIDSFLSGTRVK